MTLFLDRYPSLAFLLHHLPYTKKKVPLAHENEIPLLQDIEVLYLNGIAYLFWDPLIKSWLNESSERDLVVIEEDLGSLASFLEEARAEEIFSHPQVHLKFLLEGKSREQLYEELALEFPFRRIEVVGGEDMRLSLMRKTTVQEALFAEDLCYHRIVENLWLNMDHFEEAYDGDLFDGAFEGIPAIICGAGPSLTEELPLLKKMADRALIFAGGSTMTALSKGGVRPHFTFALDPNPQEVERLQETQTFEVPLFYGGRVKPEVLGLVNGMKAYLRTHTGGPFETYLQKILNIGTKEFEPEFNEEALSVTTTCLSMAVRMGCSPIIFVGVDLAFTGGHSYAAGVVPNSMIQREILSQDPRASERLLERTGHQGQKVYTLVKWVMESQSISAFIENHREVRFINATKGGLGFHGAPFTSLSEIPLTKKQDLEGLIHALFMQRKLCRGPLDIRELKRSFKESLTRSLAIIEEILQDPRKEIYLKDDLEAEEVFNPILCPVFHAVHKMAERKYRNDVNRQIESKFNYLKSVIEYLLAI